MSRCGLTQQTGNLHQLQPRYNKRTARLFGPRDVDKLAQIGCHLPLHFYNCLLEEVAVEVVVVVVVEALAVFDVDDRSWAED